MDIPLLLHVSECICGERSTSTIPVHNRVDVYKRQHKCSLFLASRLPVIIWEEAALASFVLENHIGFTVRSLKEINDILKNMDIKDYSEMKHNARKISENLRQGYYLKHAINEIVEKENIH